MSRLDGTSVEKLSDSAIQVAQMKVGLQEAGEAVRFIGQLMTMTDANMVASAYRGVVAELLSKAAARFRSIDGMMLVADLPASAVPVALPQQAAVWQGGRTATPEPAKIDSAFIAAMQKDG